jgi:uncharacterized protein
MKKILSIACLATLLSACAGTEKTQSPVQVGMANPASVFCVEQGGKLEIRKTAQGESGYCHLSTGQVVEEWQFFRSQQPKCIAESAKTLIGSVKLTEAQIKEKTNAQVVRMVEPNQPVTMDYREERVTVTVEPKTQKIIQASCG